MQSEAIRDELLKVDALGRVRVTPERREALLDVFESCGVSAREFAAHVGVKSIRRLRHGGRSATARGKRVVCRL